MVLKKMFSPAVVHKWLTANRCLIDQRWSGLHLGFPGPGLQVWAEWKTATSFMPPFPRARVGFSGLVHQGGDMGSSPPDLFSCSCSAKRYS